MASQSTSPAPPNRKHEGNIGSTLSKDALYAPLLTYADGFSASKHFNAATGTPAPSTAKKPSPHSLSLQPKSTVPSLIASLTTIGQHLKTSHPHECHLYRSMGGSVARFGMGDADRADAERMRSTFESHLLHRNLVLVGGGVHTHTTPDLTSLEKNKVISVVGLGIAQATLSSGKRERKRTGGNGIFGSISNKRRKRKLQQIAAERASKRRSKSALKIQDGDAEPISTKGEQPQNTMLENNTLHCDLNPTKMNETVGTIIRNLHQMWSHYIGQLIHAGTSSMDASSSLSVADFKQVSMILTTAEHVGMPATIVDCPSRRHLVRVRCVVVHETQETWKMAMIARKNIHKDQPKARGDSLGNSTRKTESDDKTFVPSLWKIIMVPKRGTILEVDVPWGDSSVSKNHPALSDITVRLET